MVQAVENLTRITGTVLARKPHPRLDAYELVSLRIDAAEAVPGMQDLLGSQRGNTIELSVRRALLEAAGTGQHLRCRAKLTPDGAMCEAHPDAGQFEMLP